MCCEILAYAASPERMQRDLSSAGKLHKSAAYRLYRYNSMLGIVFNLWVLILGLEELIFLPRGGVDFRSRFLAPEC